MSIEPLKINDLRPHIGRLNWQLRRLGVTVAAVVDGDDVLGVEVRFAPASSWVVTCERCRHHYLAGRDAKVVCPKCGCLEVGEERLPVLGAADTVVEFDVRGALMGVSLHEARSRLETALVIAGVKGEVSVREP